jgi:hypothetical protein
MHLSRSLVVLTLTRSALALAGAAFLGGCGGGSSRSGFEEPAPTAEKDPTTAPPTATGAFETDKPPPSPTTAEISEVFGHSNKALFRLDPKTKAVTQVGDFDGCESVIDIALDESSTLYAVSYNELYTVDKTTAKCTSIAQGNYPNSLSFVPKGTVDQNVEALVGYEDSDYVRIDTKTGVKTKIGALGGGLKSSGDIVSVKGGKTYLTVKGTTACTKNDCLVEVDPAKGSLVKNWGSIEHKDVFGLSFWAGKIYGFNKTGDLFEVVFGTSQLATTLIPMPGKPTDLSFWGAGSSTAAPLVDVAK